MNDRRELIWAVQSLAPLRKPGRLRSLGGALQSDPDFAYTQIGRSFPPHRKPKGSLAEVLGSYESRLDPNQPEMWFFARHDVPTSDGDLYVADDRRLNELDMPHSINAGFGNSEWFASPERLLRLSAYLARVADAAGAFYAYCASSEMLNQRASLLQRNAGSLFGRLLGAGRVAEDLHVELPDVYWWNYFGAAFVHKWGGKLDGLGVHQEATSAGARVIWATESPFVFDSAVRKLQDYPWKRAFYAALGDDVFMHETQKQRGPGEVVPDFNAHRVVAGNEPASGALPVSRPKALPRAARLRELPPEEAAFDEAVADLIESEAYEVQLTAASVLSVREVLLWLQARSQDMARGVAGGNLIVYRNPDTGVVAAFEPKGRDLDFRLPYQRPTFFGTEVIPILLDMASKFGLKPANGEPLTALAGTWAKGNEEAVWRSNVSLPFMSPERSERWWLYQRQKRALHERLGEDVFVPTLVAVAPDRKTEDLQLHITWTDGIPLVFPPCDLVTLLDGRPPSQFTIRGTADCAAVRQALGPFLEGIAVDGLPDAAVLKPEKARAARRIFQELPTRPMNHIEVAPAGWVDIAPAKSRTRG